MLDRYGVLTRGDVVAERLTGRLLGGVSGAQGRRGTGPGPARLLRRRARARPSSPCPARSSGCARSAATRPNRLPALVLAAADPANPYGAALPWPAPLSIRPIDDDDRSRRGHQPARKAGALVVLVDGECALYVERGGRTLLSFTDDPPVLQPAADALALTVRDGALGKLAVERADGAPIVTTAFGEALAAAGFRPTPRGLRLRG